MKKSIWLLSLLLLSCSAQPEKAIDKQNSTEMEKKNIGSLLALYPKPLTVVGAEVGETSLRTEPGVLTMYAVGEQENPCKITILETYASRKAYEKHIASEHFQKYKQGTLHMVKSLVLSDQTPLNPANRINNFIE